MNLSPVGKQVTASKTHRKFVYFFLFAVTLIWLLNLVFNAALDYQDRHFAAKKFSFMPYEGVLESRKWLKGGLGTFGCTYAIISLGDASPTNPPSQWIDSSFWHQTPLRFKEKGKVGQCRNIICECESDWSPATYQLLTRALSESGSFYYLGWRKPPHDTLYQEQIIVYSPVERVAAIVTFGD